MSVADIRSAPWYPGVKRIFDEEGVPESLWESIIMSEDGSLNTRIAVADHHTSDGSPAGYSYGLFQLNQNPRGTDPYYAAQWSAAKLVAEASREGVNLSTASPSVLLNVANIAAWPGEANPPDIARRQANLQQALSDNGKAGFNPLATVRNALAGVEQPLNTVGEVVTNPSQGIQDALGGSVGSASNTLALVLVTIAFLLGGVIILAGAGK